jgi:isopentenyl-diphosphate Delta-isomerase
MKESVLDSAKKRLQLEMGIDCNLEWVYSFIYKQKVENNLIEYGIDHIFKG